MQGVILKEQTGALFVSQLVHDKIKVEPYVPTIDLVADDRVAGVREWTIG